jgi:hypothetical protein
MDQESDNPGAAREQIRQMAVSVNSMSQAINTTAAVANSVLAYNSTNSRFEPTTTAAVLGYLVRVSQVSLQRTGTEANISGIKYKVVATETLDPNNAISISNGELVLSAGSWVIFTGQHRIMTSSPTQEGEGTLYIVKDNAIIKTCNQSKVGFLGGTNYYLTPSYYLFRTVETTETLSFWNDSPVTLQNKSTMMIAKLQ